MPSADDPRWRKITLILELFAGTDLFKAKFEDTQLWTPAMTCQAHEFLVKELREMIGAENVVVK